MASLRTLYRVLKPWFYARRLSCHLSGTTGGDTSGGIINTEQDKDLNKLLSQMGKGLPKTNGIKSVTIVTTQPNINLT